MVILVCDGRLISSYHKCFIIHALLYVMPRNQTLVEADDLFKIEMPWLKKNGYLQDYKSSWLERTNVYTGQAERVHIAVSTSLIPEENYIKLHSGDSSQTIQLTTTCCRFGNKRYWFECHDCKRRIAVLYRLNDYFSCQQCHNLTYHSKRLNPKSWTYAFEQAISLQKKIHALEASMVKRYYQGRQTKKYARLDMLYKRLGNYSLSLGAGSNPFLIKNSLK